MPRSQSQIVSNSLRQDPQEVETCRMLTLETVEEADGAVNGSLNGFEDDVSMFQAE